MKTFAPADYAAVLLYLFAIAAIGASFYRRRTTARDYFLGGRAMSWIPVGISIIAADLSAISIMGSPAWAYKNNVQIAWMAFAYPLIAPVVIFVFVPFYARLNLFTAYEYLERRFHLRVRLLVSALFQLLRGWHVAVAIYGPALVINLVTGMPVWQSIVMMGLFTTFYTTLGGMRAVIWTDVVQFVTVVSGIALIVVTALHSVPGGASGAWQAAHSAGKLDFFNLSTDPAELTSLWACLLGGAVLCLAPLTTDQAILQRLFTTRSPADCRQSVILQSVLIIPIVTALNATGLILFAFYRSHPDRLAGLPGTDSIVPFFVVRELPAGAAGLVIASILAASMAVMSAGINSLTTASIVDFYGRLFRPGLSPEHYASVGRWGTLTWGIVCTCAALAAGRAGDLAVAYNRVSAVLSGPMLGVFLLGTVTRRATSFGVLAGACAGGLAVVLVMTLTNWSFFYQGPIGVAVTFTAGYTASFLGPAPSRAQTDGLVLGTMT